MRLLPNIIYILSIHFTTTEEFLAELYSAEGSAVKEADPETERVSESLLVLYVTGVGVVSKRESPENEEFLKRIRDDREIFAYSCNEASGISVISFIRKSQLNEALSFVEEHKLSIVREYFDSLREKPSHGEILKISQNFFKECSRGYKRLFLPGSLNSAIAYNLYKRHRMYVLPLLFLILVFNQLLLGHLTGKYAATANRLQSERSREESEKRSGVEKRTLFAGFYSNILLKYSNLCDRIASDVPGSIVLRNLNVMKVTKNPEQGREPEVADRSVEVAGSSPDPESVSVFIAALGKESFNKELTLKSLRQEKGKQEFNFLIEIKL
jgi:hypothetical protein